VPGLVVSASMRKRGCWISVWLALLAVLAWAAVASGASPDEPTVLEQPSLEGEEPTGIAATVSGDGVLVAWTSVSRPGLMARPLDAAGTPTGPSLRASIPPVGARLDSPVTVRVAGGVVLLWRERGSGRAVMARRVDVDGYPAGPVVRVADLRSRNGGFAAACALGRSVLVVWADRDQDGVVIRRRMLGRSARPLGGSRQLGRAGSGQPWVPSIACAGRRALVAWQGGTNSANASTRLHIRARGTRGWAARRTLPRQNLVAEPRLALAAGQPVLTWRAWRQGPIEDQPTELRLATLGWDGRASRVSTIAREPVGRDVYRLAPVASGDGAVVGWLTAPSFLSHCTSPPTTSWLRLDRDGRPRGAIFRDDLRPPERFFPPPDPGSECGSAPWSAWFWAAAGVRGATVVAWLGGVAGQGTAVLTRPILVP
jgi:hypothetical protein